MNFSEVSIPSITSNQITCVNISHMVGTMAYFAFDNGSPPSGRLYCDGSAVSRTVYANLFSKIGTAFGTGNGSSTFNLPDTRGHFLRCCPLGSSRDPDSSRAVGSIQGFGVKRLSGDTDNWQRDYDRRSYYSGVQGSLHNTHYGGTTDGGDGGDQCGRWVMDSARQSNTGSEFRPKNHALISCIKY